jgi:hypothetical protein
MRMEAAPDSGVWGWFASSSRSWTPSLLFMEPKIRLPIFFSVFLRPRVDGDGDVEIPSVGISGSGASWVADDT